MRASICGVMALVAAASLALPVLGQTTGGGSGQTAPCKVPPNQVTPSNPKPHPYTAEFKITNVQTLGNGATITQESTMVQARDSQSRIMSATTMIQQYGDHTPITMVSVQDPWNGTQSNWDSRRKQVKVIKLPPLEQQHGCWQAPNGNYRRFFPGAQPGNTVAQGDATGKSSSSAALPAPQPQRPRPVMEDLGTATIQGVEARGQRWTTTTPAGEIGNDQPLVHMQEDWFATGLGINVRNVADDPQQGKRSMELVKLDQSEPDPALFQPPEGYEIVTEEMVPCKE